jgi:ABC-type molybdate transport system permease subunit
MRIKKLDDFAISALRYTPLVLRGTLEVGYIIYTLVGHSSPASAVNYRCFDAFFLFSVLGLRFAVFRTIIVLAITLAFYRL